MFEMLHLVAVIAMWIIYGRLLWNTAGLLPPVLATGHGFHPLPGFWWMATVTLGFGVLTVQVTSSYFITLY